MFQLLKNLYEFLLCFSHFLTAAILKIDIGHETLC